MTQAQAKSEGQITRLLGVFRYSRRAVELVWGTSRALTLLFALLTLCAGILPAGIAYTGKLIVDGVLAAIEVHKQSGDVAWFPTANYILLEAGLVAAMAAAQRGISAIQSLLRAQLGQRVNVIILEKALTLPLTKFEDSEFYDKMTRARMEASSRPLSLVMSTFGLIQNAIALTSLALLLVQFSPWAIIILVLGALPGFIAEAKFSGDAFRLFRWQSQENRMQMYLETVLAREDSVKEVKLFQLGPRLLERYRDIFNNLYRADRNLTLRRDLWGFLLGLVGTIALYAAYGWIAFAAITLTITLGQMTMYVMVFKQGQTSVTASLSAISGMYEDNLYLSNLYEYLEQETPRESGDATCGTAPGDGIRFENVSFTYLGAARPALCNINLHIKPGTSLALVGENGAGKTTLIKLLSRLYRPQDGRILLDGLPLDDWDFATLHKRIGVIFQDFVKYQMLVGENVGAGDVEHFHDQALWAEAADKGMAAPFIEQMPQGYETQLGRWFNNGQELSGGQWQKIALSRAFMRRGADILVLDEPTAAMDAEAEARIFKHFREHTKDKMAILISHRFSTVRMADQIIVIDEGEVVEQGDHQQLLALKGTYARLFTLQAQGYH